MFVNPGAYQPLGVKLGRKAHNSKYRWWIVGGIAVVLIGFFGTLIFIQANRTRDINSQINSFTSCARYYPVTDSYPAICHVPGGRTYRDTISQ